ncbi:MAG: Amino acid/amide ABC transporter ATP-binding protein 2, HAAT family [Parcubacteria group bacterium GW2011_GWC2_44_17]|nr:MAG: Amino acid/amide ABC transporter ATP-binding protein 2, HAAT family [Parcubacteria group bacterium GW2011_GWC2_44_17]
MQETLLQLKNISVHYGGVKALDGVTISLDEGEFVALMGPNGAGKSTVLKAIFGLAPIEKGEVRWRGSVISPISHEMVERGVSFVPQGRRMFTHLTVLENLEMGGFVIRDSKLLKERINEALDLFPMLKPKLKAKSGTLSGGGQQMVALARGLITDPKVLLLDEPSLGLAPKLVKAVFEKIHEIHKRRGVAIIIVEHNIKSLLHIVSRAYVFDKGSVVIEGKAESIVDSGILERVFLGHVGGVMWRGA